MQKTSAQTALRKHAATRWKEEIRSGRLGGEEAQMLSKHFKWPERMEAAIPKMLERAGNFQDIKYTMGASIPKIHAALARGDREAAINAGSVAEWRLSEPPYYTNVRDRQMVSMPERGLVELHADWPQEVEHLILAGKAEEANTIARFHEAQEALESKRFGHDGMAYFTPLYTHKGRGTRTLKPEVTALKERVRNNIIDVLSVPRHKLRYDLQNAVYRIHPSMSAEYDKILDEKVIDPIVTRASKWMGDTVNVVRRRLGYETDRIPITSLLTVQGHISPKVVLREVEEAHFLSPELQALNRAMRRDSGEFGPGMLAQTAKEMANTASKRMAIAVGRAEAARTAPLRKIPGLLWKGWRTRI